MATASNASTAPIQAQNSPRSRPSKSSAVRGLPSPSASPPISGIIVDQEQFLTSSSSTSSDSLPIKEANTMGDDGLAEAAGEDFQLKNGENGAEKKPVWNKPSPPNGAAVEAVGAVMGAESWPALGESARASPKSPSAHSLKPLSHGSISVSQTIKRCSGSSSPRPPAPVADNISQAPTVQHGSTVTSTHSMGKFAAGEPSRDNTTTKDGGQKGGSYSANEVQPQRTFRRNNSGPLTRGDGSYHHGGRRDQERGGKQDWGHRSFNHRDSHGPQQRMSSRPFLRGPAPNAPFVPPPPVAVRPFVAPVVYTEMQSPVFYVPGPHPDSLRPMPMVPMPSMFFSMHDPHLPSKIVNQIDYYFSNENLVKDTFLRQNMDGEGWVSIKLIAGFKKVKLLTDNIQLILDVIKSSNAVEVQGDRVRRKGDWMKWIMSPTQTTVMSPQSINRSSPNMLSAHLNSVTLDEKDAT